VEASILKIMVTLAFAVYSEGKPNASVGVTAYIL